MARPSTATFHHSRPEAAATAFDAHLAEGGIAHMEGPLSAAIQGYSAGLSRPEMAQTALTHGAKPSMA